MKIKKTFQGELPENRIVNAKSNSQTDAYSANYLNDKLNKVVVSPEEPTTGEEVWVKRSINTLKFEDFTEVFNGITFTMKNQVLYIKGTATAYTQTCYMAIKKTLEEDMTLTQYTSGKADGIIAKAAYTYNGTSYYPNLFSVELDKDTYLNQLYFIISEGSVVDAEVRFQLERGKGTHDWQPVMDKQVFVKNDNGVYEEFCEVDDTFSDKNILNSALFIDNKYLWFDGTEHDDQNTKYWRTGLQKIKPSTTYYSNVKMNSLILYDMYRKPLRAISDVTEISTASNEYYIQISFAKSGVAIDGQVVLSKTRNETYSKNIDSSDLQNYSLIEQKIGTWIDGKPLYRKVVNYSNALSAGNNAISHNISNIDVVTKVDGYTILGTNNYRTGAFESSTKFINIKAVDSTYINVHIGSDWGSSFKNGFVTILEYTKTTD